LKPAVREDRWKAGQCTLDLPKVDHLRRDVVRERDGERRRVWKRPVAFVFFLLGGWKVCFPTRRHAAVSEHPPERRGPCPASEEGRPVLTTAPWSQDHGDGNTGRLPLRSAVEGVLREALRANAVCLRLPFVSRQFFSRMFFQEDGLGRMLGQDDAGSHWRRRPTRLLRPRTAQPKH